MKTINDFIQMGMTREEAMQAVQAQFAQGGNVATATPPPLGNLATSFQAQNEQVLAGVDLNNPNQIFAPEPRRGVPDSWLAGKVYDCKFLANDAENSIQWASSGQWEFLQARVVVDHKGGRESLPVDGVQASALFSTFVKDGTVPTFYARVSMRDRKPDPITGAPRSPIKVVDLFSKIGCNKESRITYQSEGGKVVSPFVVIGW
jgi:hypothetical protein